jgi:hypothetical protein
MAMSLLKAITVLSTVSLLFVETTRADTPVATSLIASANPPSITVGQSTVLNIVVQPNSGTNTPGGYITVKLINGTIGTAELVGGRTSFGIAGTSLAQGNNNVNLFYQPSGAFGSSTAVVPVYLMPSTSLLLTSSAATVSISDSFTLTATITPSWGVATPYGSVVFSLGAKVLATVTSTSLGSQATASKTLKGSSLAPGSNVISASFVSAGFFGGSSNTTTITLSTPLAPPSLKVGVE